MHVLREIQPLSGACTSLSNLISSLTNFILPKVAVQPLLFE